MSNYLQLARHIAGLVFNSRSVCLCTLRSTVQTTKRPNLKLKTRSKQLLGLLPLAFTLTAMTHPRSREKERFFTSERGLMTTLTRLENLG
jgi:hypothetical protein